MLGYKMQGYKMLGYKMQGYRNYRDTKIHEKKGINK